MISQAVGKLSAGGRSAVAVLKNLAQNAESEAVRQSSARTILEFMLRGNETLDLTKRLEELEQAILKQDHGHRGHQARLYGRASGK